MSERTPNPQINVSKISGGAGVAGAMVAIISTLIFLVGIPALRYFLPAAIALGCVVAIVIHFKKQETPGKPWILTTEKKADSGTIDGAGNASTHTCRTLIPSVRFS